MAGPRVAHARRRRRTGHGHVAGGHPSPRRSTRTPVWGATWQWGVGIWRAHGLVGLGKYIGAVTQMHTAPLHFIRAIPLRFLRVGLWSVGVLPLQDMWRQGGCRMNGLRLRCIDVVDTESTRSPSRTRAIIRSK